MGRRFGNADGVDAPLAVGSVTDYNDMKSQNGPSSLLSNIPTPVRNRDRANSSAEAQARAAASANLEDLLRRKGIDEAWSALEDLQRQNILTDKYTVSRMLMKTVGDGRLRLNTARVYRSISIVEKFIDMQPKDVDEVLFNALLDTCCRLKDLNRLESIVTRMRALKVTPSPVTLGILVKTYGQAGDLTKVLQVWDEMEKQRGQANAVTYGCMIDACVKCGNLQKAVDIFTEMRKEGKHRNTILYTTLIKGYGLDKDLKSALELFREMPREAVPYNTITYNSIIDACVKCNELTTAEALMRELTSPDAGLEPDLITFSTLLKGYCYVGELDKALQVAEAIKARGLRCDELVYNTLMDGCVKANDIAAGVGLFEEMVQNGMRPSAITHSILVRLYQRTGSEEEAAEAVSHLYEHHGIERPSGGDRGRHGMGMSRKYGNRSPQSSYGGRSPTHSPMGSPSSVYSGYGQGIWSGLDSMPSMPGGHDNGGMGGVVDPMQMSHCPSAPSTPCYSPLNSSPTNAGAMRNMPMPPPMPGFGGGQTPTNGAAYGDGRSPTAFFAANQSGGRPAFFPQAMEPMCSTPVNSMMPMQMPQQMPQQQPPQQPMMPPQMQNAGGQFGQMGPAGPPACGVDAFGMPMMPAGGRAPMPTGPLATPGTMPAMGNGYAANPMATNVYPEAFFENWANGNAGMQTWG